MKTLLDLISEYNRCADFFSRHFERKLAARALNFVSMETTERAYCAAALLDLNDLSAQIVSAFFIPAAPTSGRCTMTLDF